MKIFVSYSRKDAGDFAEQIQNHFSSFKEYDIFTDVDKIKIGDVWNNIIATNISKCDIFLVLVTYGSLNRSNVEKEVLQAQRENKKIIPCFYKNIKDSDIKWGLNTIQGIEFNNNFELVRNLQYALKHADGLTYQTYSGDNPKETLTNGNLNHRGQSNEYHSLIEKKRKFSKKIIGGVAGAAVLVIVIISIMFSGLLQTNGYIVSKQWGSEGTADGQFSYPYGIAVDSSGNVYVTDLLNHRIQKFDSNGNFITKWSYSGEQFYPRGITVDSSNNVYVTDWNNNRIQVFSPSPSL